LTNSYSNFKLGAAEDDGVRDKETVVYATQAQLPLTNVTIGTKAYVTGNNTLYLWNGSGWGTIALLNTAPSASFDSSSYIMDSAGGESTILTLTASDPEGIPLTYSYSFYPSNIVDSAIDYAADSSVLTLTTTASGGAYNFKVFGSASDGINTSIDSADIELTLQTMTLSSTSSTVNEGGSFTYNIQSTGLANGTAVGYQITGVNGADINQQLTGNIILNSGGLGSLPITVTSDYLTEGVEYITLTLNEPYNTLAGNTSTVTINDTSLTIGASVSRSTASVNEGGTFNFTITTTNVPNNSRAYYRITGVSQSDISSPSLSASYQTEEGYVTINNNSGTSPTYTAASDSLTEGNENFYFRLTRIANSSGTTLVSNTSNNFVTINDTSLTPPSGTYLNQAQGSTPSGTWTVPANVYKLSIFAVAGGGGSGSPPAGHTTYGAGGGGGGGSAYGTFNVNPGNVIWYQAGQTGPISGGSPGYTGIESAFRWGSSGGSYLMRCTGGGGGHYNGSTAAGGYGYTYGSSSPHGSCRGGSGGGASSTTYGTLNGYPKAPGGGGGGAGGYAPNNNWNVSSGGNGGTAGGSGGATGTNGGGGGGSYTTTTNNGGGGVGPDGLGTSGYGGGTSSRGGGGSGGSDGVNNGWANGTGTYGWGDTGGDFGGGSGGNNTPLSQWFGSISWGEGGRGGGAIRIRYGDPNNTAAWAFPTYIAP
jgi:hypothetical protein